MSIIKIRQKGSFKNAEKLLKKAYRDVPYDILRLYGEKGVMALYKATPYNTGETARAWTYHITKEKGRIELSFINDYAPEGVKVAILLQYGHATKNGGWVEGVDYINPALAPIFEELKDKLWKEVTE